MAIATSAPPNAPWPPEECPEWCSGHRSPRPDEHLEDRYHADHGTDIDLSIEYDDREQTIIVGLRQYPEGPALIELSAFRTSLLTVDEARALSIALSEAVTEAAS